MLLSHSFFCFSRSSVPIIFTSRSFTFLACSFSAISSKRFKIPSRASLSNFAFFRVCSNSFNTSMLSRRDCTSIVFSVRTYLLIKSFTLSTGLNASAFKMTSKNLSSRLPSLCRRFSLYSFTLLINFTFSPLFLNSSGMDGLFSSVKKEKSSSFPFSIYHRLVGESFSFPEVM